MASVAVAVQDDCGGSQLSMVQPVANGASLSGDLHNLTVLPKNEQSSSGNGYYPKVRKPYTITKQRERWSEEEHKKFLEALKLYGRAWRRIEEHVGTKTAVQIRSHAQKFFSKVVRESGSNSSTPVEPIEIPPPRPKRKPMHPYPRKMAQIFNNEPLSLEQPLRSSSPNSSFSEAENQSPTSVLSAVVPDISDSNSPNQSLSPVSPAGAFQPLELALPELHSSPEGGRSSAAAVQIVCAAPPHQLLKDNDDSKRSSVQGKSIRSLKLFGRTVLVTECHRPSSLTAENSEGQASDTCEKKPVEMIQWDLMPSGKGTCTWTNLQHLNSGVFYCLPVQKEDHSQGVPWWTFSGGMAFPFEPIQKQDDMEQSLNTKCGGIPDSEIQKEGSLTGSNSGSVNGEENLDNETQSAKLLQEKKEHIQGESSASPEATPSREKSLRGFVPYKKRKVERESQSSSTTGGERDDPRVSLCL